VGLVLESDFNSEPREYNRPIKTPDKFIDTMVCCWYFTCKLNAKNRTLCSPLNTVTHLSRYKQFTNPYKMCKNRLFIELTFFLNAVQCEHIQFVTTYD